MLDNLNIHQAESLVRLSWLNGKGSHKRLWVSKAKAASSYPWKVGQRFCMTRLSSSCFTTRPSTLAFMNQVEIWRSHLVCKVLQRGNFISLHDLRDQSLAFIAYYNRTLAKPIKWTYSELTDSWSCSD
jgi:hypothetical protein